MLALMSMNTLRWLLPSGCNLRHMLPAGGTGGTGQCIGQQARLNTPNVHAVRRKAMSPEQLAPLSMLLPILKVN